jgi:hypothetical protein
VKAKTHGVKEQTILDALTSIKKTDQANFDAYLASLGSSVPAEEVDQLKMLKKYFANQWSGHPIDGYIVNYYLHPGLPKFMYYDDYYMHYTLSHLPNVIFVASSNYYDSISAGSNKGVVMCS